MFSAQCKERVEEASLALPDPLRTGAYRLGSGNARLGGGCQNFGEPEGQNMLPEHI